MAQPFRHASTRRFFLAIRDLSALNSGACHPPTCRPRLAGPRSSHTHRAFATTPPRPQHAPDAPPTHYDLFPESVPAGPPPAGPFAVDVPALRREFLRLQGRAHPDKHAGADKARAAGLATRINEAYRTLQHPLRRAQYLLALRGVDVAADETASVADPALLAEVLEVREAIEELEDEAGRQPLVEENEERIERSLDVLQGAFARDDIGAAKDEAVRLRYWYNIKESLHDWEKGKPVVLVH